MSGATSDNDVALLVTASAICSRTPILPSGLQTTSYPLIQFLSNKKQLSTGKG